MFDRKIQTTHCHNLWADQNSNCYGRACRVRQSFTGRVSMEAILVRYSARGEEGLRFVQKLPETEMDLDNLNRPRSDRELFCA